MQRIKVRCKWSIEAPTHVVIALISAIAALIATAMNLLLQH